MATLQSLGTVRLRLRLGGEDYQETLHAVQGDTGRVLEFDVLDGDGTVVTDLTGVTPVLFVRRPDGKEVGSATGEIVGGVIRITIPSSLLAYAGETKAQIQLVDNENQHKLHDHLYRLQIEESLEAGASPGENLWFSLAELTEAIAEVNLLVEQYDTDVDAVAAMRDDVTTKHGQVVTMHTSLQDVYDTEQARRTAESARITAETDRQTAETGRMQAESERAAAETERATKETNRIEAEAQRDTDEDTRVANESIRQANEGMRVSQEGTRQTNETARVSAESIRQTAETGRVNAESARIQQWQTWEGLIEEGAMPNATSTTAGAVKVDALSTESAPYTVPTMGTIEDRFTATNGAVAGKQDKLTAGDNITIDPVTNTISGTAQYDDTALSQRITDLEDKEDKDTITTINGKTGAITKADITALGIPSQDTVYQKPSSEPISYIQGLQSELDSKVESYGTNSVMKIAVINAGGSTTGIPNNSLILELE